MSTPPEKGLCLNEIPTIEIGALRAEDGDVRQAFNLPDKDARVDDRLTDARRKRVV
jgi:hypothetical protein